MKIIRKILSLFLAFFMLFSNIGPAFASQDFNDETNSLLEQREDIANEEQTEIDSDKEANELNEDKQEEILVNPPAEPDEYKKTTTEEEPQPPIENPLVQENNEEESEEKKINLKIKVRLIGLAGKEFSFEQIFPFGASLDFVYFDKETNTEQRITKKFTSIENEIDFSNFYPEEIKNGRLELKTDDSNLLLVDQNKDLSSYSSNEEFTYEIYQLPNTKLKFKTYDTEGKQVANPKFGKFTYRLKDIIIENLDIGRDDSKALIEKRNLDNWKDDKNPLAEVSLKVGENSYIEDDNFTYEIIKENHEDNDFTKPFEVSLLRKPKTTVSKSKSLDSKDKTLDQKVLHKQAENSKESAENKDKKLDLGSQILGDKDKINPKSSPAKNSTLDIKEKNKDDLQISPAPEENRQMADQEEEPGFMETRVVVRVKLHPLVGKSIFYFNKAFSEGTQVVLEGECIDCRYDDIENGKVVTKTFNDDFLESKTLENKIEQEIDFGIKSQLYFGTNNDEYEDDDRYIEAYYDPDSDRLSSVYSFLGIDWSKGYPTTILGLDIYQSHNTEIIVKTIDENKKLIANPNGSLTHTIGSENRKIGIPSDSKAIDPFDGLRIGGGNYDNFNGSKESKVSLDGADANGFLVDGEFAYKIIKQVQRNKVEPLEVTIQKKPLVRTTNPNNSDYVKVNFLPGDHGSINENKTYWVLKGVDIGSRLNSPEVNTDKGYKFKNWDKEFPKTNQSFSQDTSFTAQYEEDDEPGYGENDTTVKLTTHGLKGKEFPFATIFPQGYQIDLEYFDIETFEVELLGSKTFTKDDEIYYGKFDQYKLFNSDLKELTDPSVDVRIIRNTGNIQKGETGYSIIPHDIYLVQNTNAIFKTIDKDGNPVDNPKSGKVSYKLGVKSKKNQAIPQNNELTDMMTGESFNPHEWKDNYDGSQMPTVSLDDAPNGFIVEGDYAYKILKQEQENDDKANPLEVTLIRKQIVVEADDQPKTKDADGNEVIDADYVKVTFDGGDHGSINENKTYWVLKGLDVSGKITGPEVSPNDGYEFESWNPTITGIYTVNTSHIAIYKQTSEEKDYNYLTYAGDIITDTISTYDEQYIRWFSLVDQSNERALGEGKSSIVLDNSDGLAKIEMDPIHHYTEKVQKKVTSALKISVENDYGAKILATDEKEIKHKKYVFAQDYYGNKAWKGVNITIKNQNTKGTVDPEDVSALQYQLTKEQIINAVKKGTYTYNSDVPEQNKTGINALHSTVDGKQILNEEKVKSITVTDEDFASIDQANTSSGQQVKATITYLDGSQSDVIVNVTLRANVPTGLTDSGYAMPTVLFILCGILMTFVSLINIRKKSSYD